MNGNSHDFNGYLLAVENNYMRIIDSNLDNYLKLINDYPALDLNHYMAYLYHHLNIDIANILHQNYLKTLQGELGLICYWQKVWLKYVFQVETAKELRAFDKNKWIDAITTHLTEFKAQFLPNIHST